MDLSSPLATVTPTLDAGVLHVLSATTAGCTAAEVHRRLGHSSDEGVRKVLARLVRQGVVLVESPARYPLYRLNREHVAVRHIEALTRVRDDIFTRIREEVAGWHVRPMHVGLFGSFARGTADSDSDVDVLVVRPRAVADSDEETWLHQIDDLDRGISIWTGNAAHMIDLAPTTLGQMAQEGDPLVDSWRAEDIPIYGERLVDVLRGLQ